MAGLRVAMVTPFPEDPDRVVGGVAGVSRTLAPALVESGHCELTLVVPDHPRRASSEWNGCRIESVPGVRGPGFLTYWTIERRRIGRVLDELAPDVVHVQGVGGYGIGLRMPWVLTLHGIPELDALYSAMPFPTIRSRTLKRIERHARAQASRVISISPYLTEALPDLPENVAAIENPVAAPFFSIERREEPGTALFVGHIGPRKNTLGLIDGFAAAGVPTTRLWIAGAPETPEYGSLCRERAAALGVADRIEFLGNVPVDGVAELLSRASCLVLPSRQETAPLAIGEAMAAGVPVLAARRCGMPFMIEDGRSGLLFDPESREELAAAFRRIFSDDERRRAFGARARELALAHYAPEGVAKRTLEIYREVVDEAAGMRGRTPS